MTIVYRVTKELRAKFKEPFGDLILGNVDETMSKLKQFIDKEKPIRIIAVGDTVSRNLFKHKICPQLSICDFKCMRKEIQPFKLPVEKTVYVENPQGTISKQAVEAIEEALKSEKPTQIIVEGEEDLLTLIVVLYAPENAIVVYGQPREGIVITKVTLKRRNEASDLLKAMETSAKS